MPSVANDIKTLWRLVKPVRGQNHQERLESFYSEQAEDYDEFRAKLLPGRMEMMSELAKTAAGNWLDVGAGTGKNIEYLGVEDAQKFNEIHLLDLSFSLLQKAKQLVDEHNLKNVQIHHADATQFSIEKKFDLITFSYSLTMIPDWYVALEKAYDMLKPGGKIAVVDFYVSKKFVEPNRKKHSFFKRTFWPIWFAFDNVFLSRDHLPFLVNKFRTNNIIEGLHRLPYFPLGKVPYYIFVGIKEA